MRSAFHLVSTESPQQSHGHHCEAQTEAPEFPEKGPSKCNEDETRCEKYDCYYEGLADELDSLRKQYPHGTRRYTSLKDESFRVLNNRPPFSESRKPTGSRSRRTSSRAAREQALTQRHPFMDFLRRSRTAAHLGRRCRRYHVPRFSLWFGHHVPDQAQSGRKKRSARRLDDPSHSGSPTTAISESAFFSRMASLGAYSVELYQA